MAVGRHVASEVGVPRRSGGAELGTLCPGARRQLAEHICIAAIAGSRQVGEGSADHQEPVDERGRVSEAVADGSIGCRQDRLLDIAPAGRQAVDEHGSRARIRPSGVLRRADGDDAAADAHRRPEVVTH